MEQSKPIRIKPKLMNEVESLQPEYFDSTTTWVNQLIRVGLNVHLGLDPCDILRKPNDRKEKNKKGSEVLSTTYSSNTINKEKIKKWKFNIDSLPERLDFCKDSLAKYWSVKTGAKSEESYKRLVTGVTAILQKYGEAVVNEQIDAAIVGGPRGPWSGLTLKNYESMGLGGRKPEESLKHPAQTVFKASDIYGEV
jgi:hypothetical protein